MEDACLDHKSGQAFQMDRILYTHQNEESSIPLIIPADMRCNVEDEKIFENVLANSKRRGVKWLNRSEPHDRVAVICGTGPSIEDCAEEIWSLDGDVFALNNAANWLWSKGITPEYQVIMDAQPRSIELLGPANKHLFASMVDPSLFDAMPDAILWHSTHGDLEVDELAGFPQHDRDYCLIGSGSTVGNTSLPLIYAMGYRKVHIFGMDSCHRGDKSHVVHQSINDGDPCTIVHFMGRKYISSFTMKLQADNFVQRAMALREGGCDVQMHGDGFLQDVWRAACGALDERTKYEIMWSMPEYRNCGSPGAVSAEEFVRIASPKLGQTVLDLGCGPGRGGQEVKRLSGCDVIYVDFARNCYAPQPFVACDLSSDGLPKGDFGFCCDVMEHIPPEQVDQTLANICKSAPHVFFRIALLDDIKGVLIGHRLHLSVHPADWWFQELRKHGRILHFTDYDHCAVCYVATHGGN